ncbi:tetratricopeptide repeat protein [Tunturibacter empetritectus]|uniref:Tetratricopeptide (TPR) repeat protein n=1 Tax=Tunturiibacter empetritectus TaxID=3069691 RepID=A0A7W8MPX3_9BACT|nr:tetratricopeptide repeat protein [Edaphobacter lichenicola]MBB5315928.1 tetratricopeptide (TPR) repeat protein [Edaphobacter lichenicola]
MSLSTRPFRLPHAFLLALLFTTSFLAADETQANALLQQGRVDEAAAMLQDLLASQPNNALAHQLFCRVYYAQEKADPAIHECELAVANAPDSSEDHMWLARAYGYKAAHASPFSALSLAVKVHNAFERAVQLDPENFQAMSDLGEYYVAAPSMIGGGTDKAQALAARMQPSFPAQSHRLLALIAEKKKDSAAAEAEYQAAVAAGKTPEAYIDLGDFYKRHNQTDKMLEALRSAVAADHRKGPPLVDAATTLSDAHSSPQLAISLLRTYLAASGKTDGAPAFKVHLQLGGLLAQSGDTDGAHNEYLAALSLASNYVPARKALQGS